MKRQMVAQVRVCGVYGKKSEKGNTYYRGSMTDYNLAVVMPNNKRTENDPDFHVYFELKRKHQPEGYKGLQVKVAALWKDKEEDGVFSGPVSLTARLALRRNPARQDNKKQPHAVLFFEQFSAKSTDTPDTSNAGNEEPAEDDMPF